MIDILADLGYINYVDGTLSAPDSQAATYAAWAKNDRLALSMIWLRVADKLIVYVSDATTSQQAWKTLKDMYEARGPIRIVLA
ncbi:hypothetical protein ONZ45_g1573 [Pleurotus djamor]|nr:hypothetical protein ONZ45_g1573 [Pleurotus djamor]